MHHVSLVAAGLAHKVDGFMHRARFKLGCCRAGRAAARGRDKTRQSASIARERDSAAAERTHRRADPPPATPQTSLASSSLRTFRPHQARAPSRSCIYRSAEFFCAARKPFHDSSTEKPGAKAACGISSVDRRSRSPPPQSRPPKRTLPRVRPRLASSLRVMMATESVLRIGLEMDFLSYSAGPHDFSVESDWPGAHVWRSPARLPPAVSPPFWGAQSFAAASDQSSLKLVESAEIHTWRGGVLGVITNLPGGSSNRILSTPFVLLLQTALFLGLDEALLEGIHRRIAVAAECSLI